MGIWPDIAQCISAAGVAIAAIAACLSARKTKNMIKAQLLIKLQDIYWSLEMQRSMEKIKEWVDNHPEDFTQKFVKLRQERRKEIADYDSARRIAKSYFERIFDFESSKIINKKLIKKLLVTKERVSFLLKYIKPIELDINPCTPSIKVFDFFEELYQ